MSNSGVACGDDFCKGKSEGERGKRCRMRFAHILSYAAEGGEARSADYNMMPRSAPIKSRQP